MASSSSLLMHPGVPHVAPDMPVSLTPCADASASTSTPSKKKLSWKKPKNMPKRPLSAYNLFFQAERQKLMIEVKADQSTYELKKRQHKRTSGVGFAGLARKIAQKWKALGEKDREPFEKVAREDRRRYHEEIKAWKQQNGDTKTKKSRSKSLPAERVFSSPSPAQAPKPQPRRASADSSHQDFVSNQRLSFLNSSTRQTRLLLQQMAAQLEALQAMAAAQTSPMMVKPPMSVMSLDPALSAVQAANPITPEHPRNSAFNTSTNNVEQPCFQPFDSMDHLEVTSPAEDWDELVEHISEDMDERIAPVDDNTTLEALWGDVCNL